MLFEILDAVFARDTASIMHSLHGACQGAQNLCCVYFYLSIYLYLQLSFPLLNNQVLTPRWEFLDGDDMIVKYLRGSMMRDNEGGCARA